MTRLLDTRQADLQLDNPYHTLVRVLVVRATFQGFAEANDNYTILRVRLGAKEMRLQIDDADYPESWQQPKVGLILDLIYRNEHDLYGSITDIAFSAAYIVGCKVIAEPATRPA